MTTFSRIQRGSSHGARWNVGAGGPPAVPGGPCLLRMIGLVMVLVSAAFAVPIERELGSGLLYMRVHTLPDDLPAKPAGRVPPCILDVRYVRADAEAAAAFSAWLKSRATLRTPVFVLANADTASPLLKVLAAHARGTGIVVLGIERGSFRPDVAVTGSPEDERRAYDALEGGASINTLLTDNPDKVRNDEASLSRDRLAEASADAAKDGKKAPPPVDLTLQRAMHLHRALVALKKI
ncbi:MAG: hypothetical protein ACREH8_24510 [Opitutaceae bacterium]